MMTKMRRMRVLMVIALIAPLRAGADDKAPRDDLKALRGTWVVVESEANGKKLARDELSWQWTFMAKEEAILADRKMAKKSQYTYTIEASKDPKSIDIVYQGPEPALKDAKQLGIYKIEDNKLTICFNLPGVKERPKNFATQAGSGFLMRLERGKDD